MSEISAEFEAGLNEALASELGSAEEQQDVGTQEVQAAEPSVPLSKLRELQNQLNNLTQENHAQRMAFLANAAATSVPQGDPLENARKAVQKGMNGDAYTFVGGGFDPILQELYRLNQRDQQRETELYQLRNGVNSVMAQSREAQAHNYLASKIPDFNSLQDDLLRTLASQPANLQQMYANNPELLIPLADALRAGKKPGASRTSAAAQAKLGVDAGDGGPSSMTSGLDSVNGMDFNSAAFTKLQDSFWGKDR